MYFVEQVYSYPEKVVRDEDRGRVASSGQRIRARNRLVRWDGGLSLDQGKILSATDYAFDSASGGSKR